MDWSSLSAVFSDGCIHFRAFSWAKGTPTIFGVYQTWTKQKEPKDNNNKHPTAPPPVPPPPPRACRRPAWQGVAWQWLEGGLETARRARGRTPRPVRPHAVPHPHRLQEAGRTGRRLFLQGKGWQGLPRPHSFFFDLAFVRLMILGVFPSSLGSGINVPALQKRADPCYGFVARVPRLGVPGA